MARRGRTLAERGFSPTTCTARTRRKVALETVIALSPRRVIDIGGGDGSFAKAVSGASNASLEVIDTSDRMVELAAARGLSANVADIENIPFEDREFDCAVANWMLDHVEDLSWGLSEVARVLTEDGALVAATVGEANLSELWELVGHVGNREYSFTRENGRASLEQAFGAVEMEVVDRRSYATPRCRTGGTLATNGRPRVTMQRNVIHRNADQSMSAG